MRFVLASFATLALTALVACPPPKSPKGPPPEYEDPPAPSFLDGGAKVDAAPSPAASAPGADQTPPQPAP